MGRADLARPPVDLVVIGATGCGTTAVRRYLGHHPDIVVADGAVGGDRAADGPGGGGEHGAAGTGRAVHAVVAPGCTDPDQPDAAARLAAVAPQAKLLYLVRDPLDRAVSEHRQRRREGVEPRELAQALLDPRSTYVRRSRFAERLGPVLEHVPPQRIAVVEHDDLRDRAVATMATLHAWLGLMPLIRRGGYALGHAPAATPPPDLPPEVEAGFWALVADDAALFAELRQHLVAIPRSATRHHPAPAT